MSDDSEQLTHRDRRSGSGLWLIVSLFVILVLYILSPPWVAKMLGPKYRTVEWFIPLYSPLVYLTEKFEIVNEFYEAYFDLIGVI